jgi:hypothetical protein
MVAGRRVLAWRGPRHRRPGRADDETTRASVFWASRRSSSPGALTRFDDPRRMTSSRPPALARLPASRPRRGRAGSRVKGTGRRPGERRLRTYGPSRINLPVIQPLLVAPSHSVRRHDDRRRPAHRPNLITRWRDAAAAAGPRRSLTRQDEQRDADDESPPPALAREVAERDGHHRQLALQRAGRRSRSLRGADSASAGPRGRPGGGPKPSGSC